MTHTRLTLPSKGFHITHKTLLDGLILLIVTSVSLVMILVYMKVETANQGLAQKISAYSTARPVAAITTPAASSETQQSLIPVDKAEVQALLTKLQSIALVPADEAPTLATVVEIDKLRKEVFFAHAALDDKLFVYQHARLAVLYRPSVEKIVNMATLFDQSANPTQPPSLSPTGNTTPEASPGAQL
jgi:hypothetical protein